MDKQNESGFSLVEMAVVIVIGAILLSAGLSVVSSQLRSANYSATKTKQQAIKDQLITYLGSRGHLPCPDTDFNAPDGIENRTGGPGTTTACTASFGLVPYQDLQISRDAALDGWSNFFSYRVSSDASILSASGIPIADWSLSNNFHVGNIGNITVNTRASSSSAAIANTTNSSAVITSHGENGSGAWTAKGTQIDLPALSNADENTNAAAGNTVYVRGVSDDTSGPGGAFDDLVMAITPSELISQLAKQEALRSPQAQLNYQFQNIKNAIIGYLVANATSTTCGLPPNITTAIGLSDADVTDPWGKTISSTIVVVNPIATNVRNSTAASNDAIALTSTGSGTTIQTNMSVGVAKGILSQSITNYATVCP